MDCRCGLDIGLAVDRPLLLLVASLIPPLSLDLAVRVVDRHTAEAGAPESRPIVSAELTRAGSHAADRRLAEVMERPRRAGPACSVARAEGLAAEHLAALGRPDEDVRGVSLLAIAQAQSSDVGGSRGFPLKVHLRLGNRQARRHWAALQSLPAGGVALPCDLDRIAREPDRESPGPDSDRAFHDHVLDRVELFIGDKSEYSG